MAAKYKFISGKQILSIFESNLDVRKYKFRRERNGVRHFIYNGVKYAAYAKNISHGGKGYESYVTRIQLPQNEEFTNLEADEVFILLGYCCNSDVFACWDVNVVRERLNRKSYVSFFCRHDISSVREGSITADELSNGFRYCLFKSVDSVSFIESIDSLFPSTDKSTEIVFDDDELPVACEPLDAGRAVDDMLHPSACSPLSIEQDDPIAYLRTLVRQSKYVPIQIISEVMNRFGAQYPQRNFLDWSKIVNKEIVYWKIAVILSSFPKKP